MELVAKESITERGLQIELGDCLGALGSLKRDEGEFLQAVAYYADGRQCEIRVKELGGASNSYCLVQELVAQVLSSPAKLSSNYALHTRLERAFTEIKQQISDDRMRDPWAYADLALLAQLMSPENAHHYWEKLDEFRPLRLIYDSIYHVLKLLHREIEEQMDSATRVQWQRTIIHFEEMTVAS